jgi:hypothetical protein
MRTLAVVVTVLAIAMPVHGQAAHEHRSDAWAPWGAHPARLSAGWTDPRLVPDAWTLPLASRAHVCQAGCTAAASAPVSRTTVDLALVGVLAAGIGAVGGAYLGGHIDKRSGSWSDIDGLLGVLVGWSFGPALTTPIAVHARSGRQGSLAGSLAAALAVSAGAWASVGVSDVGIGLIAAAPLIHVITSVAIEQGTSDRGTSGGLRAP